MRTPRVRLHDIVEVLRSTPVSNGPMPTTTQVRILVDDIWAMTPLAGTASRPEMTGLSEADLISVAERFGKHRAQSLKRELTGKIDRHDVGASAMLVPPPEADIRAARELLAAGVKPYRDVRGKQVKNTKSRVNPNGFPRELFDALAVAQSDWGILPMGYDRDSEHGRDVHGSLSALLAQEVNEAEIVRFVSRTYSAPTMTLEADHVQVFHWFVSHGLELKLLELVGKKVVLDGKRATVEPAEGNTNVPLAKLMVASYDLLEVAREDAVRALARVVSGQVTEPSQVAEALATAQWLAPGRIGKLVELADRAQANPGNDRLLSIFEAAVASFNHSVRTRPDSVVVRSVSQMNAAHLTHVLTLSGMDVDTGEEKAASNELRTRLIEMGLRNDLDRELPEAMRAWRTGRLEEFYASRHARLDGDPDWVRLYDAESAEALAVGATAS